MSGFQKRQNWARQGIATEARQGIDNIGIGHRQRHRQVDCNVTLSCMHVGVWDMIKSIIMSHTPTYIHKRVANWVTVCQYIYFFVCNAQIRASRCS